MCQPKGPKLPSSVELLYRQVKPAYLGDGDVLSDQAFKIEGGGCPSVSRESLASPQEAWTTFTSTPKKDGTFHVSAGVWAVSIEECYASRKSEVYADALPHDQAHAIIEMGKLSKPEERLERMRLAALATKRRNLYRPPSLSGQQPRAQARGDDPELV